MMDVSFRFGNGWGDQGEQKFSAVSSTQRLNSFEKVPIPVSIADLTKVDHGEEKFHIGTYTFNTIKLIGVVASVHVDQDQTCITYELIDATQEGVKMTPRFTVIRYLGIESHPKYDTLCEGAYVQAVGKLRFFNNRFSLISFHIHEVESMDEVELFKLEARIAYLYYIKKITERNASQLESIGVPFFACHATMRNSPGTQVHTPGFYERKLPAQTSCHNCQNLGETPVKAGNRSIYQQKPVVCVPQTDKNNNNNITRGLSGQQAKIFEYVRRFGVGEMGVSVQEIQVAINGDDNLLNDIDALVNKYILYSTIDAEHFATIDE